MDAAALAQTVREAMDKSRDIAGQNVLRRYQRWRKGDNALVLGAMKGFKTVFGSDQPGIQWLRRFGLEFADTVSPLKSLFARHAMGLSGDLPEICKSG